MGSIGFIGDMGFIPDMVSIGSIGFIVGSLVVAAAPSSCAARVGLF
ncbi:MAG TPA: hypothetical protein VF614_07550 [Chthoniobacteraceae bacterium]